MAVGGGVLGNGPVLGEDVGGDHIVALVLVHDAKVAHGGARLAILACPEVGNRQLAGGHQGHCCLEEVRGIAVAHLAKVVGSVPGEGAGDTVGGHQRVRLDPGGGDEAERRCVGPEPEGHHIVGGEGGDGGLDCRCGALVNLKADKRKTKIKGGKI